MTGEELYSKLSVRDYSGSDADEYAQLLGTIFIQVSASGNSDKFFKLLKAADDAGKKITVNGDELEEIFIGDLAIA